MNQPRSAHAMAGWAKASEHGYGVKGPAGWMCIVESVVGECTLKNGGILEWTPKPKT